MQPKHSTRRKFLALLLSAVPTCLIPRSGAAAGKLRMAGIGWNPEDFSVGSVVRVQGEPTPMFDCHPLITKEARTHIAWGIRFSRALAACEATLPGVVDRPRTARDLRMILTDSSRYVELLSSWRKSGADATEPATMGLVFEVWLCRQHMIGSYWSLGAETLHSVQGGIATWLAMYGDASVEQVASDIDPTRFAVDDPESYFGLERGIFWLELQEKMLLESNC